MYPENKLDQPTYTMWKEMVQQNAYRAGMSPRLRIGVGYYLLR